MSDIQAVDAWLAAQTRPTLLDAFCCQGGCSVGYALAGFAVYGVDLFTYTDEHGKRRGHSQKRYPFPSHQGDAVAFLREHAHKFDAVHASPPCQAYSVTKHSHSNEHPELVEPTRAALVASGRPYVMENVVGAPLDTPLTLCGTEFGLIAIDTDGTNLYLKRHRLFESNVLLVGNGGCRCAYYRRLGWSCAGAYGGGSSDRRWAKEVRRGGYTPQKQVRERLLGIDWMTQDALSQSIPPAYTEHLGLQLLAHLTAEVAA